MIAVHYPKRKYITMKSSFSEENLTEFIKRVLIGKEPADNLPNELPKLKQVEKWTRGQKDEL